MQIKKCYYRLLTFSESSADSEQHLTAPEVRGQPLMSLYGAAYTSAPRGDVFRTEARGIASLFIHHRKIQVDYKPGYRWG